MSRFCFIIPTLDFFGYLPLMIQLYDIAFRLKVTQIFPSIPNRWGVHNSMKIGTGILAASLKTNYFRALVIGSDTHIENPSVVADYIEQADEEGVSFVANMKPNLGPQRVTNDFIPDSTPDWAEIQPPGYGFYYGDLWADYDYHNDGKTGEDGYFLEDNFYSKGKKIHFAKEIRLKHYIRRLE